VRFLSKEPHGTAFARKGAYPVLYTRPGRDLARTRRRGPRPRRPGRPTRCLRRRDLRRLGAEPHHTSLETV